MRAINLCGKRLKELNPQGEGRCLKDAKINILLLTIIEQREPMKNDDKSKGKLLLKALGTKFGPVLKNLKQSTVMKFIIQLESCEPKLLQPGIEDGKSLSYVLIKSWR